MKLKNQVKYLRVVSDVKLKDLAEIGEELFNEICLLEPFGSGNTIPTFEFTGEVIGKRSLKEKHLALTIGDRNGRTMRMMGFYAAPEWQAVEIGQTVRVQFVLSKNEFRGKTAIDGNLISLERI